MAPKLKIQGDKLLQRAKETQLAMPEETAIDVEVEVIPDIPHIQTVGEAIPKLQDYHERIQGEFQAAYRRSLPWARLAGEVLIQVKSLLPHGEFRPWLESNTQVKFRQCQAYMAIARGWEEVLNPNAHSSAHLPENREPTISQAAAAVVAWEREQKGQAKPKSTAPEKRKVNERRLVETITGYLKEFTPQTKQEKTMVEHLTKALMILEHL